MISKKWVYLILSTATVLSFQNCQKAGFTSGVDALDMNSLSADNVSASTKMNTPVDFSLQPKGRLNGVDVSFSPVAGAAFNGKFEVIDAATFKFRYTPDFGFRGQARAEINLADAYGTKIVVYARVNVGNPLSALQPALAVRGMGCIQCHANVNSNIITDFGFGDSFYFGQMPAAFSWSSGTIYGDHGPSFNSMITAADKAVIVPKAAVPSAVKNATGAATLAEYVRGQFAAAPVASTRSTAVTEMSSVYIGAPTDADLTASFMLTPLERSKFYPNDDASPALQGLTDRGASFEIRGAFACDGDLVLRGPLFIENMSLETNSGCRLYVIGSVFFYGPLNFSTASNDRNLQITSSRSISMGLGEVKKSGTYCDPSDRYALDPGGYGVNSLVNRFKTFWTVPGNFVRQSADPIAFGTSVVNEADVVASAEGPLYDAACRPEGRGVSFERLLINAPIVHGRYQGDFKGTVIAEQATMSLGAFVFEFDPVFERVPVLPFLDPAKYLAYSY